eukprot:TRINITY_DN24351_c0_g1_i1.p1 TRINITY_DN24351_c0_g1~~TRINITY_DN24351_c0_g1_i1.p1  ORF type:complete len:124 (+),score=4.53 TRINITY_DN24351_c0_g1_i1:160-531(+)
MHYINSRANYDLPNLKGLTDSPYFFFFPSNDSVERWRNFAISIPCVCAHDFLSLSSSSFLEANLIFSSSKCFFSFFKSFHIFSFNFIHFLLLFFHFSLEHILHIISHFPKFLLMSILLIFNNC